MNSVRIVLAIIIVNAAGIALRYFDLSTYFIFIGFRFHLSSLLPIIFLLNEESLKIFPSSFREPLFKKKILPFLWVISALIILLAVLSLLKEIKPGDPDYFYEFGLSSVFDYPLYLLWNFPQLCFLFLTLMIFSRGNKFSYLNVFIGLILLFGFELIPFDSTLKPMEVASLVLISLIASFFVTKLQNIYWFSVIIFSSVWSIILLFGSKSETLINVFFANQYSSWDGFFETSRELSSYIIPSFFLLILILILFYSFLLKQKA